ncbi:MAG: tetratricopeptide repeat protein [Deltaproteobacteria bacterium]|nr:tetratricopeptide repeat protein [Deltaproteobacteria bacterium]
MISMDRQHLALMMEAGYIYLGMQRFKEAKEVFEGVQVLKPESEIPLVALAGVYFCQGKLKEAVQLYKKALKITPESIYAKAYLGESLYFLGEKPEALKLLKQVDLEDSKGSVGDFARALLDAIHKGFSPEKLSQVKEIKDHYEKKKKH